LDSIIAFLAEYFYLGVVALALVVILWFYRRRLPELAIAGVIIAGLSYLLSILATDLISDPRPFIQTGIAPLIQSATDNGFPSDHTLLLGIVAAVITLASWRTGLIFWGLALLVGLARVYARVHHLADVIGSFGIVLIVLGVYLIGRQLYQRWRKAQIAPKL